MPLEDRDRPSLSTMTQFQFEGLLEGPVTAIDNLNHNAAAFLPYNPTIVEIGAYEGAGTVGLAVAHPYATIFACEPNTRVFGTLVERVRAFPHVIPINMAFGNATREAILYLADDDRDASLLPLRRPSGAGGEDARVRVRSTTLDDWCLERGLTSVQFLRLDAGGFELQILQRARAVLKSTLVVVTKTHFARPRTSIASYRLLRTFLEMAGFELLCHWYEEGRQGEATFVQRVLYDSVFR
jgi:FkbM family methyltransferase